MPNMRRYGVAPASAFHGSARPLASSQSVVAFSEAWTSERCLPMRGQRAVRSRQLGGGRLDGLQALIGALREKVAVLVGAGSMGQGREDERDVDAV